MTHTIYFETNTMVKKMIDPQMAEKLNIQLNKEFHSAYLYLDLSAKCSSIGFNGAANWFFSQYQEENSHALKLFRYLDDQSVEIELKSIAASSNNITELLGFFEAALSHEQKMSHDLNELGDYAFQKKDHATYNLLQWYVTEQVEEESTISHIIDQIRIVGDNGHGLLSIDKELGVRSFVAPN